MAIDMTYQVLRMDSDFTEHPVYQSHKFENVKDYCEKLAKECNWTFVKDTSIFGGYYNSESREQSYRVDYGKNFNL